MRPRHVYVHVPFCARRCSYCDFAIAVRRIVPIGEYIDALNSELELRFPRSGRSAAETIYFGGGTPSLLGPEGVARTVELVLQHWQPEAAAEITLEANPENVTADAARAWQASGINRVSLGAQSFHATALEWMHRTHSAARAGEAITTLRDAGIDNLSVDLIFALPESVERNWRRDLDELLRLDPPHVSLYGLTFEPATPLGKWRDRGDVSEAPEERFERDFLAADAALRDAGYEHYEVSNYAKPGFRARHNSAYWERRPYAGLGPSAHSFDGAVRRWNLSAYAEWQTTVASGVDPMAGGETLTETNRAAEEAYLGLRTNAGIAADETIAHLAEPWIAQDWAKLSDGRLVLTPSGWLRLDTLAAELTRVPSR
ncbi:MAG: radical SAM family heme chaperone HemW [Gemmatimonadota bacterium]|nr:radical SAM family heme chaperone HemW [Gemmatimonadota bacterium]